MLEWLCIGWSLLAVVIFFILSNAVTAPFGRHTSDLWGPSISQTSGWILFESASLLVFCATFFANLPGEQRHSSTQFLLASFYIGHYIHRALIYPWFQRVSGKQMPLVVVAAGIAFNCVNGALNGYNVATNARYTDSWLFGARFLLGLTLFVGGMASNIQADYYLISLRATDDASEAKRYYIPRGALFHYVSCANLFCEIIEWTGFAVMCWSWASSSFLLWTLANLIPRALAHHRFYRRKFEDYPMARKAVLPFVL